MGGEPILISPAQAPGYFHVHPFENWLFIIVDSLQKWLVNSTAGSNKKKGLQAR